MRQLYDAFLRNLYLTSEELFFKKKEGDTMVELDGFRAVLNSYSKPLVEVRDSL